MPEPKFSVDDMIQNAIGDKPVGVQKAFDQVMVQKVANLIGGKKETFMKGLFDPEMVPEEPVEAEAPVETENESDVSLEAEPTEDEIQAALDDIEQGESNEDEQEDNEDGGEPVEEVPQTDEVGETPEGDQEDSSAQPEETEASGDEVEVEEPETEENKDG